MKREDQIRKEILMQLYATRPVAISADRIARDGRKAGYDYTVTEVNRELQFLCDRNLIFRIEDKVGTAHLYRIHADGVAHYEQNLAA